MMLEIKLTLEMDKMLERRSFRRQRYCIRSDMAFGRHD